MTTAFEKISPTQLTIVVSMPYAELEPLLAKAGEKLSSEIEIEGFRKGKAPYEIVKQKVGEFKILEEAARLCINKNFPKILEKIESGEFRDKSFEPVGEPAVAITKLALGEDLEYKITLFLLPQIELPDYKAAAREVIAAKKAPEVTDAEIESSKNWLRESRSKLIAVNRGAEKGDRVEVDYEGRIGGIKAGGLESKNHPLILGQNRFIPGFEDNLIGMKAGEEKTFNVAAPGNYHARDLAGKTIEFTAKMNLVQKREMLEWNDEFAKSLGKFGSANDAEASIREGLKTEKEKREKERIRIAMIEAVAEKTPAEIPAPLIASELEKMVAELDQSISRMGLKFDDYLAHVKKTADDLKKEWRGDAEKRVKIALILREIAKRESLGPTDDEIKQAVSRTVEHRGLSEEDVKKIDRETFISYNKGIARNEKVFQFLESLG